MAGGGGVGCADPSAVVLLPRTFSSKKAAAVVSVNSEEQELEAIQDFFTSVVRLSTTLNPQDTVFYAIERIFMRGIGRYRSLEIRFEPENELADL